MRILLTNDDGILAPGLAAMYKQLSKIAEVFVVAPADIKSASGHSITLSPLRMSTVEIAGAFKGFSIEGSPADCVKIALTELISEPIDLVVSGCNEGANVGINVFYSGTVAAAIEGAFFGLPSIAVSAAIYKNMNFDKAAEYAVKVIQKILPLKAHSVININIPIIKRKSPKGIKVVSQSTVAFKENYKKSKCSSGQTIFQLIGQDHGKHDDNSDVTAMVDGYITITPLHYSLTDNQKIDQIKALNLEL